MKVAASRRVPLAPLLLVVLALLGFGFASPTPVRSMAPAVQQRVPAARQQFTNCWTSEAPPNLCSVDMLTASDGWAVGAGGRIIHWNGRIWDEVTSPVSETLRGVSMVSRTDGWAAGHRGALVRWDGVRWTSYPMDPTEWFRGLHMRTATDGWLVSHRAIWHWDGAAWTRVQTADTNVVSASSATDVWAMGVRQHRWNGLTWSETGSPGSDMFALKAFSPAEAWAGGLSCLNKGCGGRKITLARWDGQQWAALLPETMDGTVAAIDGVAGADVWALGWYYPTDQGVLAAWHWNGTQLTAHPLPAAMLGVSMVTATDGWAVGVGGEILHWDGAAWRPYVPLLRQTYLPLAHR